MNVNSMDPAGLDAGTAVQDLYPDPFSYCYGCGRLNEHGLQIKSYIEGDQVVCKVMPASYHLAVPGFVYGGLIASLIDCHSIGTAAAAAFSEKLHNPESDLPYRFVTKSLHVDYLKPTPIGTLLTLRASVLEVRGRHHIVQAELYAAGELRARGEVVAVPIPDDMVKDLLVEET
jgi:acyl-coenzyme A thioesterase PaaI-like protein